MIEALLNSRADDVVWYPPDGGAVDVNRLVAAIEHLAPQDWRGKRVALATMPVIELVCALVFLDGLAEAIVLLPTEEGGKESAARAAEARADIVLDAGGLGIRERLHSDTVDSDSSRVSRFLARRPACSPTTWLLPTSGTTGTPRLVAHTFSSLTRSMSSRRGGADYVWGSLYSLRRFAGLQVFLQSWLAGTPLVLNEDADELGRLLVSLSEHGCNALSGTPSLWRKLLMHPALDGLDLKQITLGGEIVDQAILDMLARRFPLARVTHIYASTEVGVGFAVRDGKSGFPAAYLANPPQGMAMRVDGQGHLWLCPLVAQSPAPADAQDWTDTGDIVRMDAQRAYFLGRANGSINVGGNKVMPEEVEAVIQELPEVAFAHVRARKSALMGSLVEVAIAVAPGTVFDAALKKKIAAHCRARLEAFKVPAFIVAATENSVTSLGKLSRASGS